MSLIDYRIGDTREVVAAIPDGSVSLVATSPPFLALRSYLPADHDAKHAEIGSEPDPATFIDTLLGLTAEWGRVLAPWGSIAIELGDTYTGAGGYGNPDSLNPAYGGQKRDGHFEGRTVRRFKKADDGWPAAKSLALIPQLYAIALAYGCNPLTGSESPAGRWRVRNVIVWHRPNPAVGALGDKYRPSTSYIVVATKDAKRWFDLTAVRTEPLAGWRPKLATEGTKGPNMDRADRGIGNLGVHPAGAPPLDCWTDEYDHSHDTWTVTTQPSGLSHYAMWPARLAERLVLSMCPAEVCSACGTPRRRVEGAAEYDTARTLTVRPLESLGSGHRPDRPSAQNVTLGWTDCHCGAHRCTSCNVVVPLRDAVQGPRNEASGWQEVGTEGVLVESVQSEGQPTPPSEDVCDLRSGLPRPRRDDTLLLEELFSQAGARGGEGEHVLWRRAAESDMEGRTDDQQGWVRSGMGAAGHTGTQQERQDDGTPIRHPVPHWQAAGAVGDGASPQRDQVGQQGGESGDSDAREARRHSGVPALPQGLHDSLTCPHCGGVLAPDPWTPGAVLDPFAGSGTTLCVAEAHGRNAIGIDLDPRNADLVPLRRQEVRRNLFGSPRVDPAQLDLFGGAA